MKLKNIDACTLIEEKDLDSNKLVEEIDKIINNEERIKIMKNNLTQLKIDDSATIIYENIKNLVDRK